MIVANTASYSSSRNLGLDLLRIIAMFMIVVLHYTLPYGNILPSGSFTRFFNQYLIYSACSCVNIYALISGYFLCEKEILYRKLIMLWGQCVFYSLGIFLMFFYFSHEFSFSKILFFSFPLSRKIWWYVNAYFGMYLLLPLINQGIRHLSRPAMYLLGFVTFLAYSVQNTMAINKDLYDLCDGFSAFWLLCCYLWGTCLHFYTSEKKRNIAWCCVGIILLQCTWILLIWGSRRPEKFVVMILSKITIYPSPLMLLHAVLLLLLFSRLKIRNYFLVKCICFFSPLTFGVYLIHMHPLVYRSFFSGKDLEPLSIDLYLFRLVIVVGVIFVGASLLEFLRQKIFRMLLVSKRIDQVSVWLKQKLLL